MDGRRLSEGLHQAIEAKEQVDIKPENVTLASVTLQNYFRLYNKLSGMTGTAETEAGEFAETYELDVLIIPTNRPIQRIDDEDVLYKTEREKFTAIVDEIAQCAQKGQPMLVGTVSIEKSEALSAFLSNVEHFKTREQYYLGKCDALKAEKKLSGGDQQRLEHYQMLAETMGRYKDNGGVEHRVLNARFHDQEASIVAQAGTPAAVTIATNMAGRGTDIQLGGNLEMRLEQEIPASASEAERAAQEEKIKTEIAELKEKALAAGGLYVLGTERHESRRIDNQLRGRTGRQGDPGRSKFYLSTEDDLMRIFGGDRLKSMMENKLMAWEEGDELTNRFMTKAVERAQVRVETRNFDIRKNLLKYDDVMNNQRKTIFEQRMEFMTDDDVSDVIEDFRHQVCEDLIETHVPKRAYAEQWDIEGLTEAAKKTLAMEIPFDKWAAEEGIADEEMLTKLKAATDDAFVQLTDGIDNTVMQRVEKQLLLQVIDQNWREHLQQLDALKSVIGMRAYGQRDPLNEYKSEAFTLFDNLLTDLREGVTKAVTRVLINEQMQRQQEQQQALQAAQASARAPMDMMGPSSGAAPADDPRSIELTPEQLKGITRNSPCPCGSGLKYKHCHGKSL